jgi:hypothetical protein
MPLVSNGKENSWPKGIKKLDQPVPGYTLTRILYLTKFLLLAALPS